MPKARSDPLAPLTTVTIGIAKQAVPPVVRRLSCQPQSHSQDKPDICDNPGSA
jgi:hypothetical protein